MRHTVSQSIVTGPNRRDAPSETVLAQVVQALRDLRFGTVTIIVQDGVVVQIDRTEKNRLRPSPE
jgi:hypothetical protein